MSILKKRDSTNDERSSLFFRSFSNEGRKKALYPWYLEVKQASIEYKIWKKQSFFETCGLYYKLIMIVIDAASVTLQIVALLTIVIDDAS